MIPCNYFINDVPLTAHWDRKMLQDTTGYSNTERLYIFVLDRPELFKKLKKHDDIYLQLLLTLSVATYGIYGVSCILR